MEDYKTMYEQALDNFKKIKAANKDNKELVDFIEYKYPELKESENEKIRKWLIELVEEVRKANSTNTDYNGNCSNAISWLEKQGGQKLINKVEPKFKVGDTIRLKGTLTEYTIESISGECYHGKGWGLLISYDDDYEIVEQKPVWSEEDEHCIELLLPIIDSSSLIPKNRKKCKKFLKSLKERVQPQPNQEWSEEDEEMFDAIIADIQFTQKAHTHDNNQVVYEREIDWLKSLKEKYAWKPSEEQMKALNYVINLMASSESPTENDYYYNVFKDLRTHLKKLREE